MVILTLVCSVLNWTPRKERPLLEGAAKNVPSELLFGSKYSMEVVAARSTSLKTAPNPDTVASIVPLVPGMRRGRP